jgi:hypothetical protein
MDEELREHIATIRRNIIVAVNDKDTVQYMQGAQELLIAAAQVDEAAHREIGIFLMSIEKTFREFRKAI